jgi:hypothetical protein
MGGLIGIMDREARFGRILLRLDSKGCETWLPISGRRKQSMAFRSLPLYPAHGLQHFGGGDHLADMPLRVIGHVDKRAPDAGGQLLAAHSAEDVEVRCGQRAHPGLRIRERCFYLAEKLG